MDIIVKTVRIMKLKNKNRETYNWICACLLCDNCVWTAFISRGYCSPGTKPNIVVDIQFMSCFSHRIISNCWRLLYLMSNGFSCVRAMCHNTGQCKELFKLKPIVQNNVVNPQCFAHVKNRTNCTNEIRWVSNASPICQFFFIYFPIDKENREFEMNLLCALFKSFSSSRPKNLCPKWKEGEEKNAIFSRDCRSFFFLQRHKFMNLHLLFIEILKSKIESDSIITQIGCHYLPNFSFSTFGSVFCDFGTKLIRIKKKRFMSTDLLLKCLNHWK